MDAICVFVSQLVPPCERDHSNSLCKCSVHDVQDKLIANVNIIRGLCYSLVLICRCVVFFDLFSAVREAQVSYTRKASQPMMGLNRSKQCNFLEVPLQGIKQIHLNNHTIVGQLL